MEIQMDRDLESFILNNSNNFDLYETCFLAVAKEKQGKIEIVKLYKYLTDFNKNTVSIPKFNQLNFIKFCIRNNLIPVLIHTHIGSKYKLEFSYQDFIFEKGFYNACKVLGYSNYIIWILYGKEGYTVKLSILNKYKYVKINNYSSLECRNKNFIQFLLQKIFLFFKFNIFRRLQ